MKLNKHISFLLEVYLLGLIHFTLFRLILFFTNLDQLPEGEPHLISLICRAFFMGFRFDTVISCYLLSFPLLLLSIYSVIDRKSVFFERLIFIYINVLYILAFVICSADIPFFNQFFSRFNTVVLQWADQGEFVISMLFQEISYLSYIILCVFVSISFIFFSFKRYQFFVKKSNELNRVKTALISSLFMAVLFIGLRGRVAAKSPIRVGTAYFTSYAFLNQLGLNPVFTLIRSALDDAKPQNQKINYMPSEEAIQRVKRYMGIEEVIEGDSPIARKIEGNNKSQKKNVVLLIMESMSAEKMGLYGNPYNLTPFLDSLARVSIRFDHMYTAGTHTFNGIFSSLFSFPALKKQHPMNTVPIHYYSGLSHVLKGYDYQTIYYTTHDDQFDNAAGFLTANGFDKIVSQQDYPSEKVLSTLGVPDHYLYHFAVNQMDDYAEKGNFFVALMSGSDHGPYIIPEKISFKPTAEGIDKQIVQYCDWSVRQFIKEASLKSWYQNTLFVIVADHGAYLKGNNYAMPLSYNHSPFIIYDPTADSVFVSQKIAGQIDVFPTIMGYLGLSYVNRTLGINLFVEERPFIYFVNDDKVGCLNDSWFLMLTEQEEKLFNYSTASLKDFIQEQDTLVRSMKEYTFSMLQAAQYLKDVGLTKHQ